MIDATAHRPSFADFCRCLRSLIYAGGLVVGYAWVLRTVLAWVV